MNHKTLTLTKAEGLAGWIYLPIWYLVLPLVITLICAALGLRSGALVNLIYYIVNFLVCGLIFRRVLFGSFQKLLADPKGTLKVALRGMFWYFVSAMVAGNLILELKPDFSNANDAVVSAMLGEFPVLITLAVTVLVPVAEECLFRGLVFSSLLQKSKALAYGVTVLLFSSVHILAYVGTYDLVSIAICFLQYAPGAAVLCRACERSDSLIPPILIHAFVNTLGVAAMR